MKNTIKGFITGMIFTLVGMTCAIFASDGIRSFEYNENRVFFNGKELDISNRPMVSIIKEGEQFASNYMSIRSILSEMGYGISWVPNGKDGSVHILTKDYLDNSDDWINLDDVNKKFEESQKGNPLSYNFESQTVRGHYFGRYSHNILTAVVGEDIYIDRVSANVHLQNHNIPLFLTPKEEAMLSESEKEDFSLIPYDLVSNRVTFFGFYNDPGSGKMFTSYHDEESDKVIISICNMVNNEETILAVFDIIWFYGRSSDFDLPSYIPGVQKADVNPFLREYGFEEF